MGVFADITRKPLEFNEFGKNCDTVDLRAVDLGLILKRFQALRLKSSHDSLIVSG